MADAQISYRPGEDIVAWMSALFDAARDADDLSHLSSDLSATDRDSSRESGDDGSPGPQSFQVGSISRPTDVLSALQELDDDAQHKYRIHKPIDKKDPLNGRTAWMHAITGALVVFNCWGMGNAYGLFQAYYETVLIPGANPSSIAWIGSTQLALVFGLGLPVGRLVDKGYFNSVFRIGTCLMVAGIFSTAWCSQLASLWVTQGLITGMGMGMVFCAGMVAMMTWFDQTTLSRAMGLAAAGSCIGGIVFIMIARHLLVASGFATTLRVLGAVVAVTMIPANVVFRIRGQPRRGDNPKVSFGKAPFSWHIFTGSVYLLAALGFFFAFMGIYFGFVYIVSYGATILQLSPTASTNLLIFMLAANLPGRFLPALLSDKCVGPLNTMIPSLFLSSAVLCLWAASEHTKASLTALACYYGFVSAGVQVLYAPAVHSLCLTRTSRKSELEDGATNDLGPDTLDTDRMGLRAGGIFTCIGLAALVGTPIGGALISYRTTRNMSSPYLGAQIFAAMSLLLGGVFLLASRVANAGWEAKRT